MYLKAVTTGNLNHHPTRCNAEKELVPCRRETSGALVSAPTPGTYVFRSFFLAAGKRMLFRIRR